MFTLTTPIWSLILSPIIVFIFLVVIMRITGRRQAGELNPFDFITLLLISDCVQNALNQNEKSLLGGMISVSSLLFVNWFFNYFKFKSPRFKKLSEGEPVVLIKNGIINEKNLSKEKMTLSDIEEFMRNKGIKSIKEIELMIMETTGNISILKIEI